METGSDMELYRHVKVRFSYSLYFDVVTIPKYRYAMCKFFARNHRLAIVSGRWLGQSRNERLCQHCQELEDEYHFVLICKKDNLVELRRRYIKYYYFVNPLMFKLTQLLTSENRKTIRNLATYVYKGLYKLE